MNIVKVRYNTDPADGREYSYYSEDELAVGDLVEVPTRYGRAKARVTAIGVSESEIERFKDAVKTIPAGSVVTVPTEEEQAAARASLPELTAKMEAATAAYVESERLASTAIIKVNPYGDLAVLQLVEEGNRLRDYATARVILSDVDVVAATDDLSLLARLKRSLEDKRKEYSGPVNDHLKAINEAFKVVAAPFEEADRITRTKVLAYRAEVERKRRETEEINRLRLEAAQREAAMNQGEITEAVVVLETPAAPPSHVRTDSGTLGTSTVWKFEVVDFKALPDEYKMVDSAKLGKVVRAGLHTIAGVRIWEEETLRITSR